MSPYYNSVIPTEAGPSEAPGRRAEGPCVLIYHFNRTGQQNVSPRQRFNCPHLALRQLNLSAGEVLLHVKRLGSASERNHPDLAGETEDHLRGGSLRP